MSTWRTYEEHRENGVTLLTTFVDREIRWSVVKDGHIIFNKSIEGGYSLRKAMQIAREQERVAENVS